MKAQNLSELIGVAVGYQSFMPDEAPLESVDFACAHGLGLVELNANMPWFFPEKIDGPLRVSLREKAEASGVLLAVHAPEEISLVSPHASLLRAGIERMKQFIDFVADIGGRVLTCHLGGNYLRWSTGDAKVLFPHQLYPAQIRESMLQTLPILARCAQERGVKLALENAGYFGPEVVQETLEEVLARSPLHLTWDVGHSNTVSGLRDEQERFVLRHRDRIALLHLHDNDGVVDSHSPLGTGTVDIPRAIEVARLAGAPVSIEVRPRSLIPQCVAAIREALA